MRTATIVCFSLLGFVAMCSATTDYCSPTLCGGAPHIGCGNTGAFSPKCPTSAAMVCMTPALKAAILQSHNSKRNTIAGGGLQGFSPAVRMATMVWNDELAKLASYNVKTCTYAHDSCRNTAEFKLAGQNLAKIWWTGGSFNDRSNVLAAIDSWWSEYKNADMSAIKSFPYNKCEKIGHFAAMVRENNIAVGCAAIKIPEGSMNGLTVACNYATTNTDKAPVYGAGATGSKCTSGMNPDYKSLCSPSEVYDV